MLNLPLDAQAAAEVAQDLPCARDYFADFARSCGDGGVAASGSDLEWFGRVERRAERLWGDERVGDDLKRLSYALHEQEPDHRLPAGFRPDLIRRLDRPVRRLTVRQQDEMLEFVAAEMQSGGSLLADCTSRNGLIQVEPLPADLDRDAFWRSGQPGGATGAQPNPLRLNVGESPLRCPLPQAPSFLIRTDRECLTFRRLIKPAWASAIGRDRFGLWCEIAVDPGRGEPVIQCLRWIPPGRFWMGSPEKEPGRYDSEGPRHQVTLTEGFWLFDAPCTQALWEAVMEKNPSRFQSPTRPVEQVSWHDAQNFLERLNGRIPDLELALPNEAQWEYACRAGTETAIYTGELAILGQNNAPALDPIAWYAGNSGVDFDLDDGYDSLGWTEKQYPHTKAGTRPIQRKRANPWGLYDMLGNVWEWTQDHWHGDYRGAPTDGSAWEDAGAGASRVLRGGSWCYDARVVRAASRFALRPGLRVDDFGFHCARVRS